MILSNSCFLTFNELSFILSLFQTNQKRRSSTEKSKWQISKWVYNAKSQVLFHWNRLKRSFNILNVTLASFLFIIQLKKMILSNSFLLSMNWVSFFLPNKFDKEAVQLKNRNDKYQSGSITLNPKICFIETDWKEVLTYSMMLRQLPFFFTCFNWIQV